MYILFAQRAYRAGSTKVTRYRSVRTTVGSRFVADAVASDRLHGFPALKVYGRSCAGLMGGVRELIQHVCGPRHHLSSLHFLSRIPQAACRTRPTPLRTSVLVTKAVYGLEVGIAPRVWRVWVQSWPLVAGEWGATRTGATRGRRAENWPIRGRFCALFAVGSTPRSRCRDLLLGRDARPAAHPRRSRATRHVCTWRPRSQQQGEVSATTHVRARPYRRRRAQGAWRNRHLRRAASGLAHDGTTRHAAKRLPRGE